MKIVFCVYCPKLLTQERKEADGACTEQTNGVNESLCACFSSLIPTILYLPFPRFSRFAPSVLILEVKMELFSQLFQAFLFKLFVEMLLYFRYVCTFAEFISSPPVF